MITQSTKLSLRVTLIYWVAGCLWIVASDTYAAYVDQIPFSFNTVQTYKGLFFVTITAVLLFWVVYKLTDRLIKNDEQYRMMFNSNPTPMWIYDLESLRFMTVNQAAVTKYGYTKDEFRSFTITHIRPEAELEKLEEALMDMSENKGYSHTVGWKHLTKKGELMEVEIISHDLSFNGRPSRLVMAIDITEKLKHLREIQLLNNNLIAQANQIKEYSYVNSHKIRRPLANILSLVEIMNNEAQITESLTKMISASAHELEKEIQEMNKILANNN